MESDVQSQFGSIDIYLFDQMLRGRIRPGARIFDAGCGGGRNLLYLMRAGHEVFGVDSHPDAITAVRALASQIAPTTPESNFRHESIESSSFEDGCADFVICSAVLHFAANDAEFEGMLRGAWRVLAPGGVFFSRLASNIGLESRMKPIGGRCYLLPDGSERYLVDEAMLLDLTRDLGAELIDPIKTTIVQNQRCMTTWVLRKPES